LELTLTKKGQDKKTSESRYENTTTSKSKEEVVEEGNNSGQLAYEFEAEDMDGNLVKLSDYRGEKVFLNFWASWCPPCSSRNASSKRVF